MKKILTDNAAERITVDWDGERFAISQLHRGSSEKLHGFSIIILNPREMLDLVEFVGGIDGEERA